MPGAIAQPLRPSGGVPPVPPPPAVPAVPAAPEAPPAPAVPAAPEAPAPPPAPPAPPPTQTPEEQVWPAAHIMLQPPQCWRVVSVSTHTPPHVVCPPGQVHAPFEQDCPPPH